MSEMELYRPPTFRPAVLTNAELVEMLTTIGKELERRAKVKAAPRLKFCKRGHPKTEGTRTKHHACLECVRAYDRERAARLKARDLDCECGHTIRLHLQSGEDKGYCQHRTGKELDCECTTPRPK